MELEDLRSYKRLKILDIKLASQVDSVYKASLETINSISGCYNNFTMHDMNHGLRVATYMEDLAFGIDSEFDKNIENWNPFEMSLLILSAILHDIGMFIRPEDRDNIKNNKIKYTNSLTYKGMLNVVSNSEEAIKEIVRITHAQRINEFIDYDFNGKTISKILMLDDKYSYADDVVNICVGHGENYDYLKKLRKNCTKGNYEYNMQYLSAILRIADYLDLDKQRTPILWYRIMKLEGFSKDEWEKHFIIHNEKKLKKYINGKLQIFFEGKSSNANIHRKYLKYIDELKVELENADELLNTKDTIDKYKFNISTKLDDCVITEGFKYSDLRLNLDYSAITELLMGKNIYGDCRLGLRELVQNSIDACKIMKEIQEKGADDTVTPRIIISCSEQKGYVKIKDTGIGMTLDVVKKHFLDIGKSYYKSNEYLYENYKYNPIGQYGIGFLACFLLSDNVIVKTKHYSSNAINQIELEKSSEYVVTNTEETGTFFGTEITLDYSKFFEVFEDKEEVKNFLERFFLTSISIVLKDEDSNESINIVNSAKNNILRKIEKDSPNSKYMEIKCEDYSRNIEGFLKIRNNQRKNNFSINPFDDKYYIYNSSKMAFEKIENSVNISDGYYNMVEYAMLDEQQYLKISNTRKSNKNKRNEIIAVAEHKIKLIIDLNFNIGLFNVEDASDFKLSINNIPVDEIIKNSNLTYYEEMLDEFDYFSPIFKYGNKYLNLQICYIGESYFDYNNQDLMDFYFYNKGVLISRFRELTCMIPYALNISGVINYKKHGIKLDVSRNYIIEGHKLIENEIANILLQFLNNNDQSDTEWKRMINRIIEYNAQDIQSEIKSKTD